MARRRANPPLMVYLNGRLVGRFQRETSGAVDFQYDAPWLAWENAIPASLSLPLREDRYIGAPVIAVFDNLLPDNEAIRRRVAARVGAEGDDAFSLLAAIGRDCVGALQFLPEGEDPPSPGEIQGEPVSDQDIASILDDLAATPWAWTRTRISGSRSPASRTRPPSSATRINGSSRTAPPRLLTSLSRRLESCPVAPSTSPTASRTSTSA